MFVLLCVGRKPCIQKHEGPFETATSRMGVSQNTGASRDQGYVHTCREYGAHMYMGGIVLRNLLYFLFIPEGQLYQRRLLYVLPLLHSRDGEGRQEAGGADTHWDNIGVILGLYGDDGKENGNYYNGESNGKENGK